jgi:aminoglycoside phosphotransferase (APT) family kinase protein
MLVGAFAAACKVSAMESISKTRIERDVAEAIVGDAFAGTRLHDFEELRDGWFNAAYAITLTDGQRVVLKVAPPPEVEILTYERDIIRAEVEALRLVRAHTEAPVPEVLWFDDSLRHTNSPLFLMTFIPGASLQAVRAELDEARQAVIDRDLGRHLRAINAIRGDHFGRLASSAPRHEAWRDAFTELWSGLLDDGRRKAVDLPVPYDVVEHAFEAAGPACDDVVEPVLVYWDLWDGNVIVDPATATLAGMLDLERACWADPLMESQFAPHELRPELLDAYGLIDRDSASARCRRAAYTLYLHVVMAVEGAYRQYPDDFIGDWARSQLAADVDGVLAMA